MELMKQAKLRFKYLQFIRDPTRTSLIFEIIELGSSLKRNEAAVAQLEKAVLQHPDFAKMWESRWTPQTPSEAALEKMEASTLGRAYLEHLKKNSLKIQFYPEASAERPVDYLSHRLYRAHDLWHVLLGYDVSPQGELELQAFSMAQIPSPASVMLIAGGLLNLLGTDPLSVPRVFDACMKAYARGKDSRFLLGAPVEDLLGEKLQDVRSSLGI